MQRNRTKLHWAVLLRRSLALVTAAMTLWLLYLTADFSAAGRAIAALADSAGLADALLTAELGSVSEQPLAGLDRLAVRQSSLLGANLDRVARWLEDNESAQQPLESASPESAAPSAQPEASPAPEPAVTSAPDDIIGRTMVPGSSSRYVSYGDIYIYNYTDYSLSIEQLLSDSPTPALSQIDGPQILIYHSHTTEAYTMDGTDIYTESDASRTTDPNFNMIRIGEEMKAVFEAAGLQVIHDDTLYDYPVYAGAYNRSASGIAAILEEYPTIQLVLDVHRDALAGSDGTVYKTVAGTVPDCAQVMLVAGSDAGGQQHDAWRENLALAVSIQNAMLEEHGTLIRPIVLRSSRFNQQVRTGALLVEVGSHGNTLQEAITAARLFAQTVAELVK